MVIKKLASAKKNLSSGDSFLIISDSQKNRDLKLPKEIKKEVLKLSELGLRDDEINYILYLKAKEETGIKWN